MLEVSNSVGFRKIFKGSKTAGGRQGRELIKWPYRVFNLGRKRVYSGAQRIRSGGLSKALYAS
jgi:hypothetical protein